MARDIEGYPDVGGLFRDRAEAEMDHAHGHLDYLKAVGDPATESPIGSISRNVGAAVAEETYAYTKMYPGMARIARDEGLKNGPCRGGQRDRHGAGSSLLMPLTQTSKFRSSRSNVLPGNRRLGLSHARGGARSRCPHTIALDR